MQKNYYLLISTCYSFVCTFKAIKKVKVTYQGQGHTSRSRSYQGKHQIEVIFKERYSYAGGLHLNQMRSGSLSFLKYAIVMNISKQKLGKISNIGKSKLRSMFSIHAITRKNVLLTK